MFYLHSISNAPERGSALQCQSNCKIQKNTIIFCLSLPVCLPLACFSIKESFTQSHTRTPTYTRVCIHFLIWVSCLCFWPLCFISSFCTTLTSFNINSSASGNSSSSSSAAQHSTSCTFAYCCCCCCCCHCYCCCLVCTPATKTGFSSYLWLFSTIHFLPAAAACLFGICISSLCACVCRDMHTHACLCMCV